MSEDTINSLIAAGPLTVITIAFLVVSIVTLLLASILFRMLKSFLIIQKETIKQTQLTREAITTLDKNHVLEVQKLAITMESISLSMARRSLVERKQFYLLQQNIKKVTETMDNFVPQVVDALSIAIKENGE